MADYNIIDAILDDYNPNYGQEGLGAEEKSGKEFSSISQDESDTSFLDDIAGHSDHNNILVGVTASYDNHRHRANQTVDGDNILADAVESLDAAQKADPEQHLETFEQVTKGGEELLQNHTASVDLKKAVLRLKRIASKTPEQMEQDGAKTASDYADPVLVPHWASQVRRDVTLIRRAYAKVASSKKAAATPTADAVLGKNQMSDAEVKGYVKNLLNSGVEPIKIAAKIEKMAELLLFNKGIATDYLKQNQGVLGYAYMEPNTYMDKCTDTYQRQKVKMGGVKAKSVKRIKACTKCEYFNKTGGAKQCNLYKLPIIASDQELFTIVNNLTKGAKDKRAALVKMANKQDQRVSTAVVKTAGDYDRPTNQGRQVTNTGVRKEASFTTKDALAMHVAGVALTNIFAEGMSKIGTAGAKQVVTKFVAGLKGTKTKVALTQIDCSLLKGKLSASNAIIGAKKCSSCTYRRGMSCGLTGGTLEHFEGMHRVTSGHKIAAGAPKDGMKMLEEFELTGRTASADIDVLGPKFASVDIDKTSRRQ